MCVPGTCVYVVLVYGLDTAVQQRYTAVRAVHTAVPGDLKVEQQHRSTRTQQCSLTHDSYLTNFRACHGPTLVGRPGPSIFDMMGRGPAHQILIWWAAARPGPSIFTGWAAARPRPSIFHRMGGGPARPINFSEDGPRPGPAHHISKNSRPGPARPITLQRGP